MTIPPPDTFTSGVGPPPPPPLRRERGACRPDVGHDYPSGPPPDAGRGLPRVLTVSLDTSLVRKPGDPVLGDTVARHLDYARNLGSLHVIVKTGKRGPDGGSIPERIDLAPGLVVHPTRSVNRYAFIADAIRIGISVGRREGIDVVSAQDPFATGIAALAIARVLRRPLNVQVHFDFAGDPFWRRERLEHRLFFPFARWIVRQAQTVRVGTTRERKIYSGWGIDPKQIMVAPVAVDLDRFTDVAPNHGFRSWVDGTGGDALVLTMCRLVPSKDLSTLLRAASQVIAVRPRTRFIVVGGGSLRQRLESEARALGIGDAVKFAGVIDGTEAPSAMASADIYALTSWYEGTSLVTLEAGASGVPVVSTDVAGTDDTIINGVTGMVVPVGDDHAFATALLGLLDDPVLRLAVGEAARRHVRAQFGRADAVTALTDLWTQTAIPHRPWLKYASPFPGGSDVPSGGLTGPDWLYVANARFPSEKAQSYQIAQMVDAFATEGVAVELVHPDRANLDDIREEDPRWFYELRGPLRRHAVRVLDAVKLVTIDQPILNRPPWPGLAFAVQALTFAIGASRHARRSRAKVIYGRDWPILWALSRAGAGRPVVWEAHDLPERDRSRSWLRRVLPRFDGIVAITAGVREALIEMGADPDRVVVAPDAVAWERFAIETPAVDARRTLGLPVSGKMVVYAGHLYPWKGSHVLARAGQFVPEDVTIYIVGGTPADVTSFRTYVQTEELRQVRVVGHVPPTQVPAWLRAADVVVLPNSAQSVIGSRYTSPLKLYEYLASGRPIVASDVPAIREVLTDGETGILVAPDDPAALAGGIVTLLADPVRADRIGTAGREWVRSRTWDARARQIRTFVDAVARR